MVSGGVQITGFVGVSSNRYSPGMMTDQPSLRCECSMSST